MSTGVLHNICEDDGAPIPEDDMLPPADEYEDGLHEDLFDGLGYDEDDGNQCRRRLINERFGQ